MSPRTLSPTLERMLRRANPNVAVLVEMSARDQAHILRRAPDQFLTLVADGGPLVSMTPASSADASPGGALQLAATDQLIVNQYTDTGIYNIPQEDGGDALLHTVAWKLDQAFAGCVLSSVTVLLHWHAFLLTHRPNVRLQIYRARRTAGVLQRRDGTSIIDTESVQVSFTPLLAQPVLLKYMDLVLAGVVDGSTGFGDVTFDLTPYRLQIDPANDPPAGTAETGDLPEIYFSITTDQQSAGNLVEWRRDAASAQTIAGLGKFRELTWTRANPNDPASVWVATETGGAMTFKLEARQYVPTSADVYALALPALPGIESLGHVVFKAGEPTGTSAALELSTAGVGGPWTPVVHGDAVAAQLTYHARVTMNASADQRRSPVVNAIGVEFRNRIDLSAESTIEHMSQEVAVPFLAASIGEGRIAVVRTGRRDYHDPAAEIAVDGPDTQLEADIILGSRHPGVTRADYFTMARASVSNRQPGPTSESFTLLSLTKTLKRKIPSRIELINTSHVVAAATSTQVTLNSVPRLLSGVSPAGNEYDGRNYYLRVRKSAVPALATGTTWTISGNTGLDTLDFTGANELPGVFAVGDEIEVHSGTYLQPPLSWIDQDPADVWLELLTVHLGVPSDRIGLSDIGGTGRAGYPPRVTDRAPGDVDTQAKLLVTLKITDAENGDELIDQLSFIMGGTTVEIAGQLVFRQIYPLRNAAGADGRITVAPDPISAVFDPRDYVGLETPTGREQRITVLACDYGANTAGSGGTPVSTANAVDVDALAALETQDVEGLGFAAVPSAIARWCYNAVDGGRLLAELLAQQVLFAASTGLRVWSWGLAEQRPEIAVGDTVVVVTDQYTDFDPARNRAIRGWKAYPLTVIGTSEGGRRLRGFLQGLADVSAVKLRGGVGELQGGDVNADRFKFRNLRITDTDTTSTIHFETDAPEVWGGYLVIDIPEEAADTDALAATMGHLPAGATSFTVPRPADKQLTLYRLDALLSDLAVADSIISKIVATPDVPHWQYDDVESATVGTEWLQLTERGIAVVQVRAQVQVETSQFTALTTPTRGPGDVSVVKGGVLGPLEYEQDVALSAVKGRTSFIRFQWLLENDKEITSPDFPFDATKVPNIISLQAVLAVATLQGDSDVQSWRITSGAYVLARDGQFVTIDLSQPDDDGTAGLAVNTAATYTVQAFNVPANQQTTIPGPAWRTSTEQDLFVYNGTGTGGTGGSPAATWDTFTLLGPSGDFMADLTIKLKASSAPAGWVSKLLLRDPASASHTPVNITAATTPAAGAVPTVLTTYVYELPYPQIPWDDPLSTTRAVSVTAELRDAGGTLMYSRLLSVSYNAASSS